MKSALIILLTLSLSEIHAQIRSDYLFGVNFSTLSIKINGADVNPKSVAGIHLGGYYEIPISKHFALQPSLIFSAKGSDYKIDTITISLAPAYVELPINALLSFDIKFAKVSLFSGPYFAYAFGGYKNETGMPYKYISYGSGKNHDLRPFDIGLNIGARLKIKEYEFSVQYGFGLSNISPVGGIYREMKNRVVGFSILRKGRITDF